MPLETLKPQEAHHEEDHREEGDTRTDFERGLTPERLIQNIENRANSPEIGRRVAELAKRVIQEILSIKRDPNLIPRKGQEWQERLAVMIYKGTGFKVEGSEKPWKDFEVRALYWVVLGVEYNEAKLDFSPAKIIEEMEDWKTRKEEEGEEGEE